MNFIYFKIILIINKKAYGNMTVVSQNCNGIIGTTNPTFNIYIYLN